MVDASSPSETIAKAMEGVTPDKLRYEADGMYLAVNGEEYGDTLHWQNWNDKPHRVVFDAVGLLRSAADQLDALALKLEAMQREMAALLDAEALSGIRALVAGWNGEHLPEEKRDGRHHDKLGVKLPTTCGAIYALDEAMTRARTLIQGEKP